MKTIYWRLIPLLLFLLMTYFFWRGLFLNPQALPSVQIGKTLPPFQLSRLDKEGEHFNSKNLQGKVALLNVWASWCAACADEQVFLLQLAHEGIPIYGLNYKDNKEHAAQWLTEWGNPYKQIGNDTTGKVGMDLGVYGTPETFLIDKKGIIRYRYAGILDAEIWQREFLPRIAELERASS
ncbi:MULTISPECIES: DsbE family thiol:disulfide interchange protein [Legionella]|uniref:DsbE family thiol:disulfide interchange protein n=1 Tax=Legionella septentrionalis TaxID=2498109 RepID=A0A3S0XS34_9GAMM|nr:MULTISPECIES: DsbE family thiol:disulfide interchange protein [Legionella]MCP0914671.1 DsbE family thiol:disulfide interchange protein [Legionella sp. 27cVA30]RUQ81612.1 DsbE family thiol:disulfide interchange protein [Legionella septentrionalis]RUQ95742.1 DsbE family thiol:disulfide interchange protein [Legionella septentrionalis]RUR09144.1 DsbE family thiol:disulfide interchange protein [Legionella septentrionalis]RUR15651.1 DsbE family thiol:disulfide interchange protein [Legionella sept